MKKILGTDEAQERLSTVKKPEMQIYQEDLKALGDSFVQDFSGEIITIIPGQSACLACALGENFPETKETPVIGVATGMIGIAMAAAAIRFITRLGEVMAGVAVDL